MHWSYLMEDFCWKSFRITVSWLTKTNKNSQVLQIYQQLGTISLHIFLLYTTLLRSSWSCGSGLVWLRDGQVRFPGMRWNVQGWYLAAVWQDDTIQWPSVLTGDDNEGVLSAFLDTGKDNKYRGLIGKCNQVREISHCCTNIIKYSRNSPLFREGY